METWCCLLSIAAALTMMAVFNNSSAARCGVNALLAAGLLGLLIGLLPPGLREQLPGSGLGRRNPFALVLMALGYALCYPLTAHVLYPLRERVMSALERHFHR